MRKMIQKTISVPYIPEGMHGNTFSEITIALADMKLHDNIFFPNKHVGYFNNYLVRLKKRKGYKFMRKGENGGTRIFRIE